MEKQTSPAQRREGSAPLLTKASQVMPVSGVTSPTAQRQQQAGQESPAHTHTKDQHPPSRTTHLRHRARRGRCAHVPSAAQRSVVHQPKLAAALDQQRLAAPDVAACTVGARRLNLLESAWEQRASCAQAGGPVARHGPCQIFNNSKLHHPPEPSMEDSMPWTVGWCCCGCCCWGALASAPAAAPASLGSPTSTTACTVRCTQPGRM